MLLAACATSRPAPAAHLGRRRDRDRPVGFADVAALPDPAWADAAPGRYSVAGLVPAGQLAAVPLPTGPRPLPPIATIAFLADVSTAIHADDERHLDTLAVLDAIAAALAARPELLHDTALLMALAPVVAMLKGLVA